MRLEGSYQNFNLKNEFLVHTKPMKMNSRKKIKYLFIIWTCQLKLHLSHYLGCFWVILVVFFKESAYTFCIVKHACLQYNARYPET